MPPLPAAEFIDVSGRSLHVLRLGREWSGTPLVFLHEGLGSVDLWRSFPEAVVAGSHRPGLVYSRYGNGWSAPLEESRHPDYMHREALDVLPAVIADCCQAPPLLIGHSDGASIALIYAGAGHPVQGLVLIAPHVFVEPAGIESIAAITERFPASDMAQRMAKYHTEPVTTFMGWADIWLSPDFASWNIEEYAGKANVPTLLVQGDADHYGTIRQLDAIDAARGAPAERLMVPGAAHSPHLSHPEMVTEAVVDFVERVAQ